MKDAGETRAPALRTERHQSLRYVVRGPAARDLPLLCFLHGFGEAAPLELVTAMTLHGPLRGGNPAASIDGFVIVAPQLPVAGDLWQAQADAVREIVLLEAGRCGCDAARLYLTGFSYGGNGVFDLAILQPDVWAALWPVDPTRPPPMRIRAPLWLSLGDIARREVGAYVERLGLQSADAVLQGFAQQAGAGAHVWEDEGLDHVATATSAYRNERIYRWLQRQRRAPA